MLADDGTDTPPVSKTVVNIIGQTTGQGRFTGLQALLTAQIRLGVKPRILGAPRFSHHKEVAKELGSIAEKLGAFAYVDLTANSVTDATSQSKAFTQRRMMLLWPGSGRWKRSAKRAWSDLPRPGHWDYGPGWTMKLAGTGSSVTSPSGASLE